VYVGCLLLFAVAGARCAEAVAEALGAMAKSSLGNFTLITSVAACMVC
jgi:hypothetical protein